MDDDAAASNGGGGSLDEIYGGSGLAPHPFHLQLPDHHKTPGGLPYATVAAHKLSRAIWKLVDGLELRGDFFAEGGGAVSGDSGDDDEGVDVADVVGDAAGAVGDDFGDDASPLQRLSHRCARIHSLLSSLAAMDAKLFAVFTREEVGRMLLKVLKLLCATVSIEEGEGGGSLAGSVEAMAIDSDAEEAKAAVTIYYDTVGCLLINNAPNSDANLLRDEAAEATLLPKNAEVSRPFALPVPARQSLLSVAMVLLEKKDGLRGMGNAAVFLDENNEYGKDNPQLRLLLSHRSLLRMLLRTAPYLDEHCSDHPPMEASGIKRSTLKKTVQLIRTCRGFFHQEGDATARQLWRTLRHDLVHCTHSHASFRALIVLYLLHPSKCSGAYYEEVLPVWMDCWRGNVDRCPEADHLWMTLLSRARKYLPPTAAYHPVWLTAMRQHLLTSCGYWFQLPVGGVSADKSFPTAKAPNRRWFPARLKAFVGVEDRYEEGMDFYGRLAKLVMFCAGHGETDGSNGASEGTADILRFFRSVAPYYHPSNVGGWTLSLGAFLYYLSYELAARVGKMAALKMLRRDRPGVAERLEAEEPWVTGMDLREADVVALLDVLLPLCQQALYGKNGTVTHAGETALSYLASVDPGRVAPPLIDFTLQALGASAVTLSHQAPAALSALTRLLQPALRREPGIVLGRLPDVLRLTLAGIDGNDQNKSLRTLIFYRNLCLWLPVGGTIALPGGGEAPAAASNGDDVSMTICKDMMETRYGLVETDAYKAAIGALPSTSILSLQQHTDAAMNSEDSNLLPEAMACISDWSLLFLDRIYELLRAAGEAEKMGKGRVSGHTSMDVAMTKNFSRILKETLVYVFAAMDDATHEAALRSVATFLEEETLPFAVKDASLLCQAACATRFGVEGSTGDKSGLDALLPVLLDDLEHKSDKCVIYRLRCLAGAVRYAGSSVLRHRDAIVSAITLALSKSDRTIFKSGCKLLRHTLSSQCEEYPIGGCLHPLQKKSLDGAVLGKSSSLNGNRIWWHVPSAEQLDFTVALLSQFALSRWNEMGTLAASSPDAKVDLQKWRQGLRVLRYAVRGCGGLLLDQDPATIVARAESDAEMFCPREVATAKLLLTLAGESQSVLRGLRRQICFNLLDVMALIAKDTANNTEAGAIGADTKICSEVLQLADLILSHRGEQSDAASKTTIWQGQKELLTDYVSTTATDFTTAVLSRFNLRVGNSWYKDGEDSGKTLPRALVVNRVHLANIGLTDSATSQVLRRLRRARGPIAFEKPGSLFSADTSLETLLDRLRSEDNPSYDGAPGQSSLEVYESLTDALFALSCHPNVNVRGDAFGVADHFLARMGWLAKHRISRLCRAILLDDEDEEQTFGIPSCARLVDVNDQGKRTRLAEVCKGVLKLMGLSRVMKQFLWSADKRLELVKTVTGTQRLLKLLPPEEVPKVIHYTNSIFLSYRSKQFMLPVREQATHEASLTFLLGILCEGGSSSGKDASSASEDEDTQEMHWRDRLVAAWFILQFVDKRDAAVVSQLWTACSTLIEEEAGQPLARVSLGLLGRLVSLALVDESQTSGSSDAVQAKQPNLSKLRHMFSSEKFCRAFGNALVFDHREDSSVGGGHSAQWSQGIEEILRDATANLAPKRLYPMNRISSKSHTFKLAHSQLIESILLAVGHDTAKATSRFLIEQAKELVASPPSEDQRNEQCTAAEIFGGVARALIQYSHTEEEQNDLWEKVLLPFLGEAVAKVPTNLVGAFFDACRYAIHHFPSQRFLPLLQYSVAKVEETLWQHEASVTLEEATGGASGSSAMADRFALQGKWLVFVQAVLAELDSEDDLGAACKLPWYCGGEATSGAEDAGAAWQYVNERLTPCLLNAIGHPYDKCRDHVASCLFRLSLCHRKLVRGTSGSADTNDPGVKIVEKLSSIRDSDEYSFQEKYRALGTARKFVALCIHWGDVRHDFAAFIIPLLPSAFLALQNVEQAEASPEDRGMEAELVKGYRYTIADISSSCVVSYGVPNDINRALDVLKEMSAHESQWQIRQAVAHFVRWFQGTHKFLFTEEQSDTTLSIAISLLDDDRREVSTAAMSALTGILAVYPQEALEELVSKYITMANKSLKKKKRKKGAPAETLSPEEAEAAASKEKQRATRQQTSVAFLAAVVLGSPYDTPPYVPRALAVLSKHSYEQRAALSVREVVKMVCREFKRTHTDNWDAHKRQFTQEQLEALDDVVSTPHYYA
ncbi:hypothetical protein ACHAXT_002678 [Thalassiosira profunda]